jgi:hypothetical protein
MSATGTLSTDEQRLAELGYKQELKRGWSGFSNFAISFSIISVLAGCFTTYGQAFKNGGPIAISIMWPLISVLILMVAFSMSELASAMPTAGGIYYWASKLGGAGWGWFTGWFNLIGLVAVVASVDYVCASFLMNLLGLYNVHFIFNFTKAAAATNVHYSAHVNFALFAMLLIIHGLINVFSSHLVSIFNGISVWWHLLGVAVIVVILIAVPSHHASLSYVFGHRANVSGFSGHMYWFYVLPLGFLLTMYTITGYDASAHVSEETHGAAEQAPKGVWRSVFYSAVVGWIVLLAITFAIQKSKETELLSAGFPALAIFESALSTAAALHDRSDLLRHGVRDERLAHDVRVLTRRRGPRPQPVAAPGQEPHPHVGGAVRVPDGDDRDDPGLLPQPHRNACGVPGGHVDLGDRAVHRVHDPGVPALAHGRPVQRRAVDPGEQVQMDEPDRVQLGGDLRGHLLPAVRTRGRVLQIGLRMVGRQLRSAGHHRRDGRRHDLVRGLRETDVHGPDSHDRRSRLLGGAAGHRAGPIGEVLILINGLRLPAPPSMGC